MRLALVRFQSAIPLRADIAYHAWKLLDDETDRQKASI